MKLLDSIKRLIRDCFVIFGILIVGSVFFTPHNTINRDYVILAIVFAALGNLPSIVFWSKTDLTENSMRLRRIIHFALLQFIILTFGRITGIVSGLVGYLVFAIEIGIIYIIVGLITWQGDLTTAKSINEKLKTLQETDEN